MNDMSELVEIYTKSKTFDNISEIMKEVNRIRTEMTDYTFEEMARYVCKEPNGKIFLLNFKYLQNGAEIMTLKILLIWLLMSLKENLLIIQQMKN